MTMTMSTRQRFDEYVRLIAVVLTQSQPILLVNRRCQGKGKRSQTLLGNVRSTGFRNLRSTSTITSSSRPLSRPFCTVRCDASLFHRFSDLSCEGLISVNPDPSAAGVPPARTSQPGVSHQRRRAPFPQGACKAIPVLLGKTLPWRFRLIK